MTIIVISIAFIISLLSCQLILEEDLFYPNALSRSNSILSLELIIQFFALNITLFWCRNGLSETVFIIFILVLYQYQLRLHSVQKADSTFSFLFRSRVTDELNHFSYFCLRTMNTPWSTCWTTLPEFGNKTFCDPFFQTRWDGISRHLPLTCNIFAAFVVRSYALWDEKLTQVFKSTAYLHSHKANSSFYETMVVLWLTYHKERNFGRT